MVSQAFGPGLRYVTELPGSLACGWHDPRSLELIPQSISIHPFICLSIHQSIYPSLSLSIHICLSLHLPASYWFFFFLYILHNMPPIQHLWDKTHMKDALWPREGVDSTAQCRKRWQGCSQQPDHGNKKVPIYGTRRG